jgi:hypothetical protein
MIGSHSTEKTSLRTNTINCGASGSGIKGPVASETMPILQTVERQEVALDFEDFSGDATCRTLIQMSTKKSQLALLIFDITILSSFAVMND